MRQVYFYSFVLSLFFLRCEGPQSYDVIILNGQVYSGPLGKVEATDIGIVGDKIVSMGDLSKASSRRTIDASNHVVAPGFIDLHVHLDPILKLLDCESHIRQGVTTALGGPDGRGPSPFGAYLEQLEAAGVGMNVAYLVGHNSIRKKVMGMENRSPTSAEMDSMKTRVAQAMEEGAFGISTGLKYLPGNFSEVDELIELSKEASKKGGIYTSHLRDEGLDIMASIDEAIEIADKASIPVILTHHKVIGKPMWGKSNQTLAKVDKARSEGLNIMLDQYPYDASHTSIAVLIPSWAGAGGQERFLQRLKNPILKDSITNGIIFNILNDRGGEDLDRIQFAKVKWRPSLEGKTLKDWAISEGLEPTVETGAKLVIDAQQRGGAKCIFHAMDSADVSNIMRHPQTMIASDGRLVKLGDGHPHPRWYGTFPRVLGHYVREKKVISLEEAIYKMTAQPAQALGLSDRGILAVGNKADITIFDPKTIIDKATFVNPHQYSEGIDYVLINGKIALEQNQFNAIRAGEVLRKTR